MRSFSGTAIRAIDQLTVTDGQPEQLLQRASFVNYASWPRHRDFAARGRLRRFFMTDSERATMTFF